MEIVVKFHGFTLQDDFSRTHEDFVWGEQTKPFKQNKHNQARCPLRKNNKNNTNNLTTINPR